MSMDQELIEQFQEEAQEIFEDSESALLELDKNPASKEAYQKLFRAFHSLKGGAGMFGMESLQKHMHMIETALEVRKKNLSKSFIDYLFKGLDIAKQGMSGAEISYPEFQEQQDCEEKNEENVMKVVDLKTTKEQERLNLKRVDSMTVTSEPHLVEEEILNVKPMKKKKIVPKKPSLYIVDDEDDILEMLKDLLEDHFQVQTFNNPYDLLKKIERLPSDYNLELVISDYNMPELDGLNMMRNVHESLPHLPFILVSGFLDKDICIQALEEGVAGLVDKPFRPEGLVKMALSVSKRYRGVKLLSKSVDLIMLHFHDLKQYLEEKGQKKDIDEVYDILKEILAERDEVFKVA